MTVSGGCSFWGLLVSGLRLGSTVYRSMRQHCDNMSLESLSGLGPNMRPRLETRTSTGIQALIKRSVPSALLILAVVPGVRSLLPRPPNGLLNSTST